MNLGAGALVCWWAASEFDLGWAPAEWLSSLGVMESWMGITGASERRIAGIQFMLLVWMTGQLCDVLDGAVARWMGADGAQGAMLDSMADLVSAGLAPSFVGMALMMEWQVSGGVPEAWSWSGILPLALMAAAAWRLARFATQAAAKTEPETPGRYDFQGIPAPFAAVYWGGMLWIWAQCDAEQCQWLWAAGVLGATLLPWGMVSRWPQVGFKHWGTDRRWDVWRMAWLISVVVVCLLLGTKGVAIALISYPLLGVVSHRLLPYKMP